MRHLLITYTMTRPGEVAETCIRLPMTEQNAADTLHGNYPEALEDAVDAMTALQGFDTTTIGSVEETD